VAIQVDEQALQAAIPAHTGTLRLNGLEGPVEIVRESTGIPHIRAGSEHDAFFAQGFVHAQDRLGQMEYDRRRALGTWAEVAGPHVLEHDLLMRRLRLGASAQADYAAMDRATRAMFDAYAAGVNAFIQTTTVLPIEYQLTQATPAPWEPWHSCAVYKVRHVLMGIFGQKLWRMRVLQAGDTGLVEKLRAGAAIPGPLIVPPDLNYEDAPQLEFDFASAAEMLSQDADSGSGSNSWVIDKTRSATGGPLLCGDSHRALDTPSVYYQNHLVCPKWDAIGFSFGGVPAFPHFGHNAHVAWCITHAGADYQDLYIERFAPNDPTKYHYKGKWHNAERYHEVVQVRGAAPAEIDVTVTHHGPVIIGDPAQGTAIAMKYSATAQPNAGFGTFLPMLSATSTDDMDAKMEAWVDPANNLLMADTQGNIAYLTRGEIPIRSGANGWLPVPGWTDAYEWEGRIPHHALPRMKNPATGFFATANNRIVEDSTYPYFISADYAPPFRAERLRTRLSAITGATRETMETVHADKVSIPAQTFLILLKRLEPPDSASASAKERLLAWDGTMAPDSVAATIYAVWREMTASLVLDHPSLQAIAASPAPLEGVQAMTIASRLRTTILAWIEKDDTTFLPPGETWPGLLAKSLSQATEWLTKTLGANMAAWRWDRIHRTAPQHPLAVTFPEYAALLNPPSVGVGGDGDTPQCGSFGGFGGSGFNITGMSVNRYCFDPLNWDASGWVVPLGACGHPGSPHFADQRGPWSEQRLLPMRYSWNAVMADAAEQQRLEPA
jgi:penicillin amidase